MMSGHFLDRARRTLRPAAVLAALGLLAAGCGGEHPLDTMDPASPIADELNTFLMNLLIVCAVVFVLVFGAVGYMSWKFRVKAPDDPDAVYPDDEFPEQTHGNTRLEIGWTIVPTVIMATVAFFTMGLIFSMDDVDPDPGKDIQKVVVVGQQWWWEFQYHLDDDGVPDIVTANEMPLPIGEEVLLEVTSRDVIHSFWVPNLHGKRDAVPGLVSTWTMETTEAGRFHGECTEFCGLSHAYMEKWVVGLPEADWRTWAANQMTDAEAPADNTAAAAGREVFDNQCASCHVINGLTSLAAGAEAGSTETDGFEHYDGANRLVDASVQIAGVAPNLTHFATRTSFAGAVFDLYKDTDSLKYEGYSADTTERYYQNLAETSELNRGALEAWIKNAPEMKANYWDSPAGVRGMLPFDTLSAEDVDNLVEFLMTLD